jgi:hypothetical protein
MKLEEIYEGITDDRLEAMRQKSKEHGEKIGDLKSKLDKTKERVANVGKGDSFDNRSRGRLRGHGRGTAAADQSIVQK